MYGIDNLTKSGPNHPAIVENSIASGGEEAYPGQYMYGNHHRDPHVEHQLHLKEVNAHTPAIVPGPSGATPVLHAPQRKHPAVRLLNYLTKNPKDKGISLIEETCGAVVAGAGFTAVALAYNTGHFALVTLAKDLGFSSSAPANFWFLSLDEIKEKTRNVALITLAMELGINSTIDLLSNKVASTVKSIKKVKTHKVNESVEIVHPIDALKITGAAAALQAYHKEVGHPSSPVADHAGEHDHAEEHDHQHKVAHPPLGGATPALQAAHKDKEHGEGHGHKSHGHGAHGHGHEEEGNWLIPFLQEARKGSLARPAQRFLGYFKNKMKHAAVVGGIAWGLSEGINLVQWPFSGHFSYYSDAAIANNIMAASSIDILIEMGGHKIAHPIMHIAGEQSRRLAEAMSDVSKKAMHIAGTQPDRLKAAVFDILKDPVRDLKAKEWEERRNRMDKAGPLLLAGTVTPKQQAALKTEPTLGKLLPRATHRHEQRYPF